MVQSAVAVMFVVVVWWLSTGVVLGLVWLRRTTYRLSIAAFSVLGVLGLVGLYLASRSSTPRAAYGAFICAVVIWGWHELTFLLGAVTGPRKIACPPGATSWRRFGYATGAVIYHEVAIATTLVVIATLSWHQPNQAGTYTFVVLWAMRLSAKLNVYLGVPNLSEEFVPEHLRYLTSYFRRARSNPLMPVSLVVSTGVLVWSAANPPSTELFAVTGQTLVLTMLALAVIEHLFLALPVPDAMLWRWAMRKRSGAGAGLGELPAEVP